LINLCIGFISNKESQNKNEIENETSYPVIYIIYHS